MIVVTDKGELQEIKHLVPRPLSVTESADAVCVMLGVEELVLLEVDNEFHDFRVERYDETLWILTCLVSGYVGRFNTEILFGEKLRPLCMAKDKDSYAILAEAMQRNPKTTLILERVIKTTE